MNAQLNNINTKPVYFPTELWDEIKSYIPAPEPPLVRCMNAFNEWNKVVLPHLPKKVVAQQLRECSSEDTPKFNEMTDPKENRYKRTTRAELCVMVARAMRDRIQNALGEWGVLYNYNEFDYMGWNPRTNIDPAILIAYRHIYKQLKKQISEYRQLNA
jgi:hypothetical protein